MAPAQDAELMLVPRCEQAVSTVLSGHCVDYGPDTLTFRRGRSGHEAKPDLLAVLAGVISHCG